MNAFIRIEESPTRATDGFSLSPLLDTGLEPVFWVPKRLGASSYWWGHVPFAHWLVAALHPQVIVELGTFNGVSFSAFCEAMRRLHIPGRCYAVDTWADAEHYGMVDDSIFLDLGDFCRNEFGGIAELVRTTFDEALVNFSDGSIDLLHIDGPHSYEGVKAEFEKWLPKMSRQGVMLFHDINLRETGFGVWKLWDELKGQYPHFELLHANGLGIVAVGSSVPEAITHLQALPSAQMYKLRERFALIGAHWEALDRHRRKS
ncbi:class I SAM-dependent methyltransferase [Roseateles sp. DB2]|uniref:class I SAM-dependent methyltransferase n=1 Tax=Roseateles sp. DB2 TaxID=3453717 RepID=UPI003EEBACFF